MVFAIDIKNHRTTQRCGVHRPLRDWKKQTMRSAEEDEVLGLFQQAFFFAFSIKQASSYALPDQFDNEAFP